MVELQYFGHSFLVVKDGSSSLVIDPIFESTKTELKKQRRLPAKMSDLKNVVVLLLTNETPEHFDKKAVEEIALKHNATVVAHDIILRDLSLPRTQKVAISSNSDVFMRGFKIKATTAHFPTSFYPLGYLIGCADNTCIYHAGVTALLDTFDKIDADVAFLPISSRTMDVVDAVRATKLIKPKIVVPMQHDIFEAKKYDITDFKKRIADSVLKTETVILSPGQKLKV